MSRRRRGTRRGGAAGASEQAVRGVPAEAVEQAGRAALARAGGGAREGVARGWGEVVRIRFQLYIARVARWAFTEPRFWRPNGAPRVNLGIRPKPEVFRVPEPANPRV